MPPLSSADLASGAEARRFQAAARRFDEENAQDPSRDSEGGRERPRELVYAHWLADWVLRLCPEASEALRLASRCQHLCRWMIPRSSFPMTRAGYLQWREALKRFHASRAGEILRQVGYPEDVVTRVQELNLKKNFPQDPESRVLEDALCLVFLEHQLGSLASKSSEEKMITVIQKTWKKMTARAQALAARLDYTPEERSLLARALGRGGVSV